MSNFGSTVVVLDVALRDVIPTPNDGHAIFSAIRATRSSLSIVVAYTCEALNPFPFVLLVLRTSATSLLPSPYSFHSTFILPFSIFGYSLFKWPPRKSSKPSSLECRPKAGSSKPSYAGYFWHSKALEFLRSLALTYHI